MWKWLLLLVVIALLAPVSVRAGDGLDCRHQEIGR